MKKKVKQNVLIIGAGSAGRMVCDEIIKHPEINYSIAGFLDDDEQKKNSKYKSFKVLGKIDEISKVIKKYKIETALIAIPSAEGDQIRKIIGRCGESKVDFRIVPGIFEIISGDVKFNQIREIIPDDLLGRESVRLDSTSLNKLLKNKSVLVTGGAGSIGSELCIQLAELNPQNLIVLDQNESETYYLEQKLKTAICRKTYIISDISNYTRLYAIFKKYKPDIVIHAAAYKHVPLMEQNISEAFRVNVIGSENVFKLANYFKSEYCILISSDKAVNPTSVMGATKRIAEKLLLLHSSNAGNKTKFSAVRFGNVLASRGSVVPLFINQIKNGGPLTITHPDIYRYFMTISEAVSLILNSLKISEGKEIFALDMGEQINITELAKNLIILAGLKPDKDIKIVYTGLRPGEKLYEELLTSSDKVSATKLKKIFIARPELINPRLLKSKMAEIKKLILSNADVNKKLKQIIIDLLPEYLHNYKA